MNAAIRPAQAADLARIKQIAVAAQMFSTEEVGVFDEMFGGYLDAGMAGHAWLVAQAVNGEIAGAAQFAPEPFADRMWNLYFLAVDPDHHGAGIGSALVQHVENDLRVRGEAHARTLVIETSSTDQYRGARRFYASEGYVEEARIRQFYGPNDDKVVFWKSLV